MKIQEFIASLDKNPSLTANLAACNTPDEAFAVAKDAGLESSLDEFATEMEKMSRLATELKEEDVDAGASNATTTEVTALVTSSVSAAATAGAAAAV